MGAGIKRRLKMDKVKKGGGVKGTSNGFEEFNWEGVVGGEDSGEEGRKDEGEGVVS